MERWLPIDEFPGYSVSDRGRVRNDATRQIMALVENAAGVVMVGLRKDGVQYKRGIAKMVAERFLPHNSNDYFDTPMHLDGDRTNNRATNLVWRPRRYALKYRQQFEMYRQPYIIHPIMDEASEEIYENSWHAAISNGLREYEVAKSFIEHVPAYPTMQRFVDRRDR